MGSENGPPGGTFTPAEFERLAAETDRLIAELTLKMSEIEAWKRENPGHPGEAAHARLAELLVDAERLHGDAERSFLRLAEANEERRMAARVHRGAGP